jgi:Domain of Unknown Function (DUF1080)
MNITRTIPSACAAALLALASGCASMSDGGWTSLIDGTQGLDNFNQVGGANWVAKDGAIEAASGGATAGYLVTKVNYKDFVIRAEFWSSDDANSGIFARCQNPQQITDESCYEANIFDQRPDQTFATGAIVKVAAVAQPAPKAGGKWNTMEFSAQGDRLIVSLNGVKTVETKDSKLVSGPIALQWGRGVIKFRKVQIKAL